MRRSLGPHQAQRTAKAGYPHRRALVIRPRDNLPDHDAGHRELPAEHRRRWSAAPAEMGAAIRKSWHLRQRPRRALTPEATEASPKLQACESPESIPADDDLQHA